MVWSENHLLQKTLYLFVQMALLNNLQIKRVTESNNELKRKLKGIVVAKTRAWILKDLSFKTSPELFSVSILMIIREKKYWADFV